MSKKFISPNAVALWGHYNGTNLGDEIVIAALIQNIRERCPDADIIGVSMDPGDTRERHGIPALPMFRLGEEQKTEDWSLFGAAKTKFQKLPGVRLARFQMHVYQSLRENGVDLLIFAGSHPLYDDWNGAWVHPYNVFKWAVTARLAGAEFVPLCVGAGPIDESLSRFFIRAAMHLTSYRSYRDESSAEVIRQLGVPGDHPVFPDLAFSYKIENAQIESEGSQSTDEREVVGISTSAIRDPRYQPRGRQTKYKEYLHKLAGFVKWLIEHEYKVLFVYSDIYNDLMVGADLRALLEASTTFEIDEHLIDPPIESIEDLLTEMNRCDYVVGGRFHSHILPFMLNKPVLGVSYHQKTLDLMDYMGQSEHCLDMDAMEVEAMIDYFQRLVANSGHIKEHLAKRVPEMRQALEEQYNQIFGPPVATDTKGRKEEQLQRDPVN